MTMKNGEAYQSLGILISLKETGRLGFAIAKNSRKLMDELVEYSAKRDELIQKYGDDLGNGSFKLSPENAIKYDKEIAQYNTMDFEFTPTTVTEDDFTHSNLTSDQMYALMWMVAEN